MDRRDVLKALALAGPLAITGRLYAAPQTSTRLLVVFLRGAYDAANVVVPVSSEFYYQSRPTLAIARPNPNDPNAALPLNGDWGLHPALKDTLYPRSTRKVSWHSFRSPGLTMRAAAISKPRTRSSSVRRPTARAIFNPDS